MDSKAIEPQTSYTMSIRVTTLTTAGKVKSADRNYYDVEVPSRGPDTVLEWASTQGSLDKLVDMAHHLIELYGGTVTIMDAATPTPRCVDSDPGRA